MKTKQNKGLICFSVFFYIVFLSLMAIGTVYDLQIDKAVFNPQSGFAHILENFGQFVCWGMWGPALTVIFLCRRDLLGYGYRSKSKNNRHYFSRLLNNIKKIN